ncbi:MAG TPA: orotidine-5'-phosphate decarboxylase [Pseudogracilibacillus sp.]|nr:orotidine-5'-phosphate decarboxylase [Pseudogracilibacillus sp.]
MNPLYMALDVPTWKEARDFLDTNHLQQVPVKVGMELFYREGVHVIEQLKERGHAIFLDLKLHDIPTTVKRAMANLASLEVDIVNIHALGGSDMIARAKEGLISGSKMDRTKLIAVTVLTSMDEQTMNQDLHIDGGVTEQAVHLAKVAYENGADGVVCSVQEVEQMKANCGDDFLTVTPGIRLARSEKDDQKRIATPSIARSAGTDSMVVGRSITKAEEPFKAYQEVMKEWNNGASY